MNARWYRVNKKNPCRVCGRIDWCGYSEDAAICMRRESDTPTRNGGWLHKSNDSIRYVPSPPIKQAIEDKPIDATGIWFRWSTETIHEKLDQLGEMLGVDTDALKSIGCAWASTHNAWAFPMKDAGGRVIGIRLRNNDGQKWAVKGSHQGLFLPTDYPFTFEGTIWIVEGPTDLAAALTLGLYAIGRAACLGQEQMILDYVRTSKARRVVIVTDNDDPGLRGAAKLQAMLPVLNCIYVPPVKDVREFLSLGGDRRMIESSIKDLVWSVPKQRAA